MTPEEAAMMLNLLVNASTDEVRKRYQELYSDYQIRLTNAPTSKLKKTYQEKLQQLREACRALAPDLVVDAELDLPSVEPTLGASSPEAGRRYPQSPPLPKPPPMPTVSKETAGLSWANMAACFLAVVFAAATAYCLIQWFKFRDVANGLSEDLEDQRVVTETITEQAENLAGMVGFLENGKLTVENRDSSSITITWVAATYLDQGSYKTVNSAYYDYPSWEVKAGHKKEIEMYKQGMPTWSGETIFYAMRIDYGKTEYYVAGAWKQLEDGVFCFRAP